MTDILKLAAANQEEARRIIAASGVVDAWHTAGARVNPVGSLATGLLMKHRDIDFHLYLPDLNPATGFAVLARLAQNPRFRRFEYRNLADTPEQCLEWHAWYRGDTPEWQIDMIQILPSSKYDGHFEHVAERIRTVLTPETKRAILELKYATPDEETIPGIEYCQAVIRDGVRTWREFTAWRRKHPVRGVVEWCP